MLLKIMLHGCHSSTSWTREASASEYAFLREMAEKSKATGKDSCAPWLSVREVQVDAEDD